MMSLPSMIDRFTRAVVLPGRDGDAALRFKLGAHLDGYQDLVEPTVFNEEGPDVYSLQWGDMFQVTVERVKCRDDITTYHVSWQVLQEGHVIWDTIEMYGAAWYGGPEFYHQRWPVNDEQIHMQPYVSNDYLFAGGDKVGNIAERYWLSSKGAAVYVQSRSPLHVSMNSWSDKSWGDWRLGLKAEFSGPYNNCHNEYPHLDYVICTGDNMKTVHQFMQSTYLGWPEKIPDIRMLRSPLWSTWARYKTDITQEKVLTYAAEIQKKNFSYSHIEIDDKYMTSYGDFEFDPEKFSDPEQMIKTLQDSGFRVTAWVHPFCNPDATSFAEGTELEHFVKDRDSGEVAEIKWWQGPGALVDVTRKEAADWLETRLKAFRDKYTLDSFKFDAGEANFVPANFALKDGATDPNSYAHHYSNMAASFGNMVEVRVGSRTQDNCVFVRMMDKDSRWGYDNGLKTLIPSALHLGLLGYPYIIPDMIGGNCYSDDEDELPERELYIRWTQITAYLPVMQFSIAPWQYDSEVVDIAREMVRIHEKVVTPILTEAAQQLKEDGTPLIRPLWWVDPEDHTARGVDSEFLVGGKLLVAPVVEPNATSRDIYLPTGQWQDSCDDYIIEGPTWLRNYDVPLDKVATFTAVN